MLLSTMIFMEWSNHKNNIEQYRESSTTIITFIDTIKKYKKLFITIGILNFLMLFCGFLGETKQIPNILSVIIGFVPFVYMFYLMYFNFIRETPIYKTSKDTKNIFYFMSSVWSLYGVAAFLPTNPKNIMYNSLDIIAKNFYGLFLSYKLYKVREK
jgi:hypothetical protein